MKVTVNVSLFEISFNAFVLNVSRYIVNARGGLLFLCGSVETSLVSNFLRLNDNVGSLVMHFLISLHYLFDIRIFLNSILGFFCVFMGILFGNWVSFRDGTRHF